MCKMSTKYIQFYVSVMNLNSNAMNHKFEGHIFMYTIHTENRIEA